MRNTYKISTILLLGVIMIISSCKKDTETPVITEVNGCTDYTMFNFNAAANTDNGSCEPFIYGCMDTTAFNFDPLVNTDNGSCISAILGCTDINAMNFSSLANFDDESCIFSYDIAQGVWNITPDCEDLTISIPFLGDFDVPLADMFPETIEIAGEGNGVVSLDINDNNVLADIANNGTVTIQDNQTISFDTGGFDPTGTIGMVEVDITGSGTIVTASNGDMLLNLAFSILSIPADADCEITFTK